MTVDASGTGRLAELVGVSLSLSALPENDSDSLICAFRLVAIEFGRDKDATLKPLLEKHSGGTFHTFGSCNGLRLSLKPLLPATQMLHFRSKWFLDEWIDLLVCESTNFDLVSKTIH